MSEVRVPPDELRPKIEAALRSVFDPEIPVNIYDLGLIYRVDLNDAGDVTIDMTLTSPACPVAGILPLQVETKVKVLVGVRSCRVNLVWDPPWTQERMTEAAKLQLGLDLAGPPAEPPRPRELYDVRPPRKTE
jgi:FeS assembly SUF system protein